MTNEILWLVLMVITFCGIVIAYRFFGKTGLYAWTAMAVIIANIQVMKTVSIFGFVTALGNVVYGTTFLVTDVLNENYGEKEAKKAVWIGFFVLITVTIMMQVLLMFTPHETDTLSPALKQIFGFLPGITVSSLAAYLIAQNFDVFLYNKLRKWTKHLWLRNNLSTMVSQLVDNLIFTFLAFVVFAPLNDFSLPMSVIVQIFVI